MVKLFKKYFYTLPKKKREEIISEFGESYNPSYLTGEYSTDVVNAEIVEDEEGTIYDIRVYDPYDLVHPRKDDDGMITDYAIYKGFDGWSHWLYGYRNEKGNDVDTILDSQE